MKYPDIKLFWPSEVGKALEEGWAYLPGYPYRERVRIGAAIPLIEEV